MQCNVCLLQIKFSFAKCRVNYLRRSRSKPKKVFALDNIPLLANFTLCLAMDSQELENISELDGFPSYTESALQRIYCLVNTLEECDVTKHHTQIKSTSHSMYRQKITILAELAIHYVLFFTYNIMHYYCIKNYEQCR